MSDKRLQKMAKFGAVLILSLYALSFISMQRAVAASSIGVTVNNPTTTTTTIPPTTTTVAPPPATTVPPTTTTTAAPITTTTTAAPSTTTTAAPVTTTTPVTEVTRQSTPDTLPDVLPPPVSVKSSDSSSKGLSGHIKSAASTTKDLVTGVASGTPVADVVQAVLPANVATVVVPAVRTASTFVFPIGLAGAVMAFLVLQQRIDSGDPKLNAAPMAHDEDVVEFLS